MLVSLSVKNYALIESLELKLSDGLSMITGETGAGKSILLGALNLILGNRADSQSLYDKSKKCIVEAEFNLSSDKWHKQFFAENQLDFEKVTIIRREISADGKSRAFINDTPVNLQTLRSLTEKLIDIHSQRENQALMSADFRLAVLDGLAKNTELHNEYKVALKRYKENFAQLNTLIQNEQKAKSDLDYLQFQLNELQSLSLVHGEQIELENELQVLNHAEEIKLNLAQASTFINNENSLLDLIKEINSKLKSAEKYDHSLSGIIERLESVLIECKDIASEIESKEEDIAINPGRVEYLNDRLNRIYKLQHKHQVKTIEELIDLQEKITTDVLAINSMDDSIEQLKKETDQSKKVALKLAESLSERRSSVIGMFEAKVKTLLNDLMMPHARLKIDLNKNESCEFNESGLDSVEWLFSANVGNDYRPISKVASGGELSRVMLCIKTIMAEVLLLPTMIFDEIDTGVSGEVAIKVASLMERISEKHQVITITHLPQIAGRGHHHYFVFKDQVNKRTRTMIKHLNNEERIMHIAKMIGGDQPSVSALNSARELLRQS